jgi:hypothetical protein
VGKSLHTFNSKIASISANPDGIYVLDSSSNLTILNTDGTVKYSLLILELLKNSLVEVHK